MTMADEDELIAEATLVLEELVAEEKIELASRRSILSLASLPLLRALNSEDGFCDWLVERPEVVEIYLDEAELRQRFRRVIARQAGDEIPSRFHPELGAAILAAPEDEQAWAVYADWLQEQGDPRGELMMLQLERGTRKDPRLQERESSLIARYRRHFYGELSIGDADDGDKVRVALRNGFFDEVALTHHVDLEALSGLESTRFLRKLVLPCRELKPIASVIDRTPLPPALGELEVGLLDHFRAPGLGHFDLGVMTRGLVRLKKLVVNASNISLGALETPALRELSLIASSLRLSKSLSSLECLERLELETRVLTGATALEALFAAAPPLRTLAIRKVQAESTVNALLPRLLASPIVGTLRVLDLSDDLLVDEDATLLLDAKESLARLESLNLKGNGFSARMRATLSEVWPMALIGFSSGRGRLDEDGDEDEDDEDEDEDERYDDIDE